MPGRAGIRTRSGPIALRRFDAPSRSGGLAFSARVAVSCSGRGMPSETRSSVRDVRLPPQRPATRARRGSPSRAVRVPARRAPATRLTGRRVEPDAATGGPRDDTAASRAVPGAHTNQQKKVGGHFSRRRRRLSFRDFRDCVCTWRDAFFSRRSVLPRKPTTPPLRRGTSRRARLASGPSRHVARLQRVFRGHSASTRVGPLARDPLLRVKSGRGARSAPPLARWRPTMGACASRPRWRRPALGKAPSTWTWATCS